MAENLDAYDLPKRARRTRTPVGELAERLARFVLLWSIVVFPWLFGGVDPFSRVVFYGVLVCAQLLSALALFALRDAAFRVPLSILPLLGGVGLGIAQLVPLPRGIAEIASPTAVRMRERLLPPSGQFDFPRLSAVESAVPSGGEPVSLYAASTRNEVAFLLAGTCAFFMGVQLFRRAAHFETLCWVAAANGAALALFGVLQRASWNGQMYWCIPLVDGGAPFGPFFNHNHAGGFLGACLACALPIALGASGGSAPASSIATRSRGPAPAGAVRSQNRDGLRKRIARIRRSQVVGMIMGTLLILGICCSLSRGAILATAVGAVIAGCASRRAGLTITYWKLVVAGGVVALGLLFWVGMASGLTQRMATLLDPHGQSDERLLLWSDAEHMVPDFWRFGSGLGTYRFVYGGYQHRPVTYWYMHVENQYLETLLDGGIVALFLLLTMIGWVAVELWRMLKSASVGTYSRCAVAGLFMLASQAVCATFDFSLYVIPVHMLILALVCGALIGQRSFVHASLAKKDLTHSSVRIAFARTCVVALCGGLIWGFVEVRRAAAAEIVTSHARWRNAATNISAEELDVRLREVQALLPSLKEHAEAHYRLAELWRDRYEIAIKELLEKDESLRELLAVPSESTDPSEFASPIMIHRAAALAARNGAPERLRRIREQSVVRDNLLPALVHLVRARQLCPTFGHVHLRLAELCFAGDEPEHDRTHFERAESLAPSDANLLFQVGELEFDDGDVAAACRTWRRSIELKQHVVYSVLDVATEELSFAQAIEQALPASPDLLLDVGRSRLYSGEAHLAHREAIGRRVLQLVEPGESRDPACEYRIGSAFLLIGEYSTASKHLETAVRLRPRDVFWRAELAEALEQQGRLESAATELEWCVRLAPAPQEYIRWLDRVRSRIRMGHKT